MKIGKFEGRSEYLEVGKGLDRAAVSNTIRQKFETFDTVPYQEVLEGVFALLAWKHSNRLVGAMAGKSNSQDLKDVTDELSLNLDDDTISGLSADLISYGFNPYEEPRYDSPPHLYGEVEGVGVVFGLSILKNQYLAMDGAGHLSVKSSSWTGLLRVRVSHRNAEAISGLIDAALAELGTDGNQKTAQARTLLLAAKKLAEAPEPPSDVIWDLIQRAGAVVGLLDIFLRIFSAASN